MTRLVALIFVVCASWASTAAAEPLILGSGHLTTSGTFNCFNLAACSASGNTVTLGAGDNLVSLTFSGVDADFPVTNTAMPVTLGTITSSAAGDRFPSGINPNIPIVSLGFRLLQTEPAIATGGLGLGFGPGGRSSLDFMQGATYITLPSGSVPSGYGPLVYSLSPGVFSIPLNGSVSLTANVGVVPEPGTLVLTGTGLLVGWCARRRLATRQRGSGAAKA